ncbi:MAG: cysteine--tRNA ligase [Chloroflexi bacterium]|nr:MAG: cysteine--tRNA ligase [Chloroflexota bacterium]
MRLHDSLSRATRVFESSGPEVKLYVCGLTPYDATHLGHAFTYVSFDVLIRYLRYLGRAVRYVQNVTDLDDPLFEKARQLGMPYQDLAAREMKQYFEDMRALNVLPAAVYPRVSDEILEMIELVKRLVATDNAYVVDGHVYFSIATDPEYGELSGYDRETMMRLARERGGDPDDPRRRDPLDFLLWRPSRSDEPRVSSPWGDGLPGWHLECSAMALKYLGASLDIHGGGSDLIFPHHENEIAQSEEATGEKPFARFWLHTGMVYLDGAKMSKSLGNMVFVRDLLLEYGADAIRLYISGCHYRSEMHYDAETLSRAAEAAADLANAASLEGGTSPSAIELSPYREQFLERMNDDLDTPGAIDVLNVLDKAIRSERSEGRDLGDAQALLRELGGVLGLRMEAGA